MARTGEVRYPPPNSVRCIHGPELSEIDEVLNGRHVEAAAIGTCWPTNPDNMTVSQTSVAQSLQELMMHAAPARGAGASDGSIGLTILAGLLQGATATGPSPATTVNTILALHHVLVVTCGVPGRT